MGLLGKVFGKKQEEAPEPSTDLAFVLLSEAQGPDAEAIATAFAEFCGDGTSLQVRKDEEGGEDNPDIAMLELSTGEPAFVAMMPMAVPNGEADGAAQFSLGAIGSGWTLPPHHAHILVTIPSGLDGCPRTEQLHRFTSLIAAVAKTTPSVGVYWGNASATHSSDFFVDIAGESGIVPRIMLWTGLSVAREPDGRPSLLSLGMENVGLPDLLLVLGEESADSAIETMFDFLAYVADRGEPIPDGDTIGRTMEEKLKVTYVRSPIDKKKTVWKIEVP
jgi:hypothetical protein